MLQVYTVPVVTRYSLTKESRPKLHSWSSFGEGDVKEESLNLTRY